MVALLPLLVSMNLIRNLKYLAPFSMVANVLIGTGMGITFYYIFQDLPPISAQPHFSSLHQLPIFFGTAIFALEGIGVVSFITCSFSPDFQILFEHRVLLYCSSIFYTQNDFFIVF